MMWGWFAGYVVIALVMGGFWGVRDSEEGGFDLFLIIFWPLIIAVFLISIPVFIGQALRARVQRYVARNDGGGGVYPD